MQKPHKDFDNSQFLGFDYVKNGERLMFFLFEYYTPKYYPLDTTYLGYDSIFVETLANELDFRKSDYIITYQKQLKELRHSPYLTKTRDGLYHCKEIPLIPTWDSVITDKVYIYRIKKNNKFRAPGP